MPRLWPPIVRKILTKKNQALQEIVGFPSSFLELGTSVVTGTMLTMLGHDVKVTNATSVVVVDVGPGGLSPPPTDGKNVNISPLVVTIAVVESPVGTGTMNVPQRSWPAEEVMTI